MRRLPRKLIIQIPCFNEAETLPSTLAALPRRLDGFDCVEIVVIDDGSADGTAAIAARSGADHVLRLPRHVGLARAFVHGLEFAVTAGAAVIVNTDADNQYCAADIPHLIQPILAGKADIVIGARPIDSTPHFSPEKRFLQRLGSWVVRRSSGTDVVDATSGFRAISRRAATQLKVFNDFSYTIETIIQAGYKGLLIASVPVRTNPPTRPSRLFRSSFGYVWRQTLTILRIFMTYRPFPFFAVPGAASFGLGFLIGLRFVIYYSLGQGTGKIQSLILAALLVGLGVLLIIVGLIADLVSVNRKLLEGVDSRLRMLEAAGWSRGDSNAPPSEPNSSWSSHDQ